MSGCPRIAQTVAINRHHSAGRRILQALLEGARGGNVAMADLGNRDKMAKDGLDAIAWALPRWLFNPRHVGAERVETMRRTMKPDALLVLHGDQDPKPRPMSSQSGGQRGERGGDRGGDGIEIETGPTISPNTTIQIVEIKYCCDTQPGLRVEAANAQHAPLAKELQLMWGCRVDIVPIMLGVGGSIFNTTRDAFEQLGITDSVYTSLARDLNVLAAEYADKAWTYRLIHSPRNAPSGHTPYPASGRVQHGQQHSASKRVKVKHKQ